MLSIIVRFFVLICLILVSGLFDLCSLSLVVLVMDCFIFENFCLCFINQSVILILYYLSVEGLERVCLLVFLEAATVFCLWDGTKVSSLYNNCCIFHISSILLAYCIFLSEYGLIWFRFDKYDILMLWWVFFLVPFRM